MLYMMCGISGSGKSTVTSKFAQMIGCEVISTDEKRAEWYGNEEDQTHNKELFMRIENMVTDLLNKNENVILDATNISTKSRRRFIMTAKRCKSNVVAVVVHTPIEIAKARNFQRDRKVPEYVIDRQYNNFQMPTKEEGFDMVIVVDNEKSEF